MKDNRCSLAVAALVTCFALTPAVAATSIDAINAGIERLVSASNVDLEASAILRAGDPDTDVDGVTDPNDNCIETANADQRDTDSDGLGNLCDADLNQDCIVNVIDLGIFRAVFFTSDPDADFDGNGVVNVVDLGTLRSVFFSPPGPSGVPNLCSSGLTVDGRLAAATLPGATVTAFVDNTSDGGGVESFSTTSNPDGSFSLTIPGDSDSAFVTLQAGNSPANDEVRLQSFAGTVGQLDTLGGNDGSVSSTEAPGLIISPVSTAISVLAQERNSAPILTDQMLAIDQGAIDTALMIDAASLIRLYIDSPEFSLAGIPDTLVLIQVPALRSGFIEFFINNLPMPFADATVALSNELRVPYADGATPDDIIAVNAGNLGRLGANVMRFAGDGSVDYTDFGTRATGDWSVDGAGQIIIDLPLPILMDERFIFIDDPNNPGQFVEALQQTFLDEVLVDRLVDGVRADVVFIRETQRSVFPDFPSISPTISTQATDRETALLAFSQAASFPLATADLGDASFVTTFFHQDHMSQGLVDNRHGADTLDFNSNGTGSTRRSGLAFTWSVSPVTGLEVTFANGDESRFEYLFDDYNGLPTMLVSSTLAGTDQFATRSLLLQRDPAANFLLPDLENRRFRSTLGARATAGISLTVFDFIFAPGGTACRAPGNAGSVWIYGLAGGRLEIERSFVNVPENFFYRTWQPIQTRPDGYWTIETLQTAFDEPQVDAAITPGRINFYSIEQELVGNQRPTLVDDSFIVPQGSSVILTYDNLLANDVDPEGDELLPKGVDLVSANGGSITESFGANGERTGLVYTPPAGFTGSDTFQYEASDLFCFDEPGIAGNVELVFEP